MLMGKHKKTHNHGFMDIKKGVFFLVVAGESSVCICKKNLLTVSFFGHKTKFGAIQIHDLKYQKTLHTNRTLD